MSDTTEIRMINLQVMAESAVQADKAAGTYEANLAADPKYYLWQSEFQTRPMGMENRPEAYAQLLRANLPEINTLRIAFNQWSFNSDGSLDPIFERFLIEAARQGFQFVFVYGDGEAQQLGLDGTLDVAAMREGLAGSVHDRMVESWTRMLDWLDAHPDVDSAVYALETVNEPAAYSRAETLAGNTGEFTRLYGDHMAEIAGLIDARSDARIMVGGWAYSSLFDILAETAASGGTGSVLDQIRAAAGDDLVWSAHLYPDWAGGAGQEIDAIAEYISDRYGALGDDDLIITETNLEGYTSGMAFWLARSYEVFSQAGIGLGWFPGAETGGSSFLTINNGKTVSFLHPDIYAQGMNAFLLGESDPAHAADEELAARLLSGNVYDESGARIAVNGLGYAAGHGGNDSIAGIASAMNMLYGGTGNDSLTGTAGRDHLFGQNDNDTLFGMDGADVLMGGEGDDFLNGGAGDDILTGGRGSDLFVLGDGGEDVVTDFRDDLGDRAFFDGRSWTGQELLPLGTLADYDGDGLPDDLVVERGQGRIVLLNQRRPDGIVQATQADDAVAVGYADVEGDRFVWEGGRVQGLAGNDSLTGSMSDDTLEGDAGDDMLAGRSGDDVLIGGDGRDSILGGNGNDALNGGPGKDTLSGEAGNDLAAGGDDEDTIAGAAGRDTLHGDGGSDTIDGGIDEDVVQGGTGNDSLLGGAGNDTIDGDGGNDVISGGYGMDLLRGGEGSDSIDGSGDDDMIDGGAGNDSLTGSTGNDTLAGSLGDDVLVGGAGNDTYIVDSIADRISETGGSGGLDTVQSSVTLTLAANVEKLTLTGGNINGTGNTLANHLVGSAGKNMLEGAAGADTLDGGSGNDTVSGGTGNDILIGGAGTDRLTGGQGADQLTGSQGADTFVFLATGDSSPALTGRDTITDFSTGGRDRLDLSAIDARTNLSGVQDFTFIGSSAFTRTAGELSARVVSGNTVVAADVNGDGASDFEILVQGTPALTADSFIF